MRTGLALFLLMACTDLLQTRDGRYLLISTELKVLLFNASLRYSASNRGSIALIPIGKFYFCHLFGLPVLPQARKKKSVVSLPLLSTRLGYSEILNISILFRLFK